MKKWPDDELDKLFRKSSEKWEPKYNPEDWNKLRSRLEAGDSPINAGPGRKKWPLMAFALLLLSGAGTTYYLVKNANESEPATNTSSERKWHRETKKTGYINNEVRPAVKNNKPYEDVTRKSPHIYPEKTKSSSSVSVQENTGHARENHAFINKPKTLPRHHLDASGVRIKPERRGTIGGDEVNFRNDKKNNREIPIVTALSPDTLSKELTLDEESLTQADIGAFYRDNKRRTLPDIVGLQTSNRFDSTLALPLPAVIAPAPSERRQEAGIEKSDRPGLALKIGISPDLSTVGMQHFTRPGTAWKLMAQYRLNRSFLIEAGIVRSLKVYDAYPGDYSWPYSWKQSVLPSSVNADCRVLEIPLNLRYDFKKSARFNWFVSGGATSYKMLNEKYVYNYETTDPSIKWYKWEGKTGWYWASHLNASIGVERKISNRISLLAEPYLRIPVKKVGFGKVNLFTSGLWISLKYRIPSPI